MNTKAPHLIRQIDERIGTLNRRIAGHEQELASLHAEREELLTTRRVLLRLATGPAQEEREDPPTPEAEGKTVGEVALIVLQEVPDGLTSGEILNAIRSRFYPNLARTSLSPPLSRLKTRGEIELVGDHWKITKEKGPPDNDVLEGPLEGDA